MDKTIHIRISDAKHRRYKALCAAEGRTMSTDLRVFISQRLLESAAEGSESNGCTSGVHREYKHTHMDSQ